MSKRNLPISNHDRIICTCRQVSIADIKLAMKNGAQTLDHLGQMCGVALVCGGCSNAAEKLLAGHDPKPKDPQDTTCPDEKIHLWSPYVDEPSGSKNDSKSNEPLDGRTATNNGNTNHTSGTGR